MSDNKYGIVLSDEVLNTEITYLINQIYKLLPLREESGDWKKLLSSLIERITGMYNLIPEKQVFIFPVLCMLEGCFNLDKEDDFETYRRTIFECLNLLGKLVKK